MNLNFRGAYFQLSERFTVRSPLRMILFIVTSRSLPIVCRYTERHENPIHDALLRSILPEWLLLFGNHAFCGVLDG